MNAETQNLLNEIATWGAELVTAKNKLQEATNMVAELEIAEQQYVSGEADRPRMAKHNSLAHWKLVHEKCNRRIEWIREEMLSLINLVAR